MVIVVGAAGGQEEGQSCASLGGAASTSRVRRAGVYHRVCCVSENLCAPSTVKPHDCDPPFGRFQTYRARMASSRREFGKEPASIKVRQASG